jgi:hypothetical protein
VATSVSQSRPRDEAAFRSRTKKRSEFVACAAVSGYTVVHPAVIIVFLSVKKPFQ